MPEPLALALGSALGRFAGSVLRIRRKVVSRNLELAFPDRDSCWRRRVARDSYAHLGREGVAMLRMASLKRRDVLRRTRVDGLEELRSALEGGSGAIVVTGHLGNWEIGGAAVAARGIPLSAVALRQGNPLFDRELAETRGRLGIRIISRGHAPGGVLEAVRDGRVAAIVADQNPLRGGIPADFFGIPANTARGPAVLALRSGVPVFLGTCVRTEPEVGGASVYHTALRRVAVERSGDLAADVSRLVQRYTDLLEEAVREHPEQYFWLHRRWKRRDGSDAA